MPLFASDLMSSPRYRSMPDTKQAWYLNLLINEWLNSENPGYLPNDPDRLYTLANARTKSFFCREGAVVLACFQVSSDRRWLFNARLLDVYEKQLVKYWRLKKRPPAPEGASSSLSDFDLTKSETKEELRKEFDSKCEKCHGTGKRELSSHPGRFIECHCWKKDW
jgi:hypothetical protein